MKVIVTALKASPAVELQAVLRAQREGLPFLVLHDRAERQRLIILEPNDRQVWLGRSSACDIALAWDERVSRVHAELVRVASGWAVVDDGLSRNGTFVGGERVAGRRRLRDGDVLRLGASTVRYHAPAASALRTVPGDALVAPSDLTPIQRKVLASLCRPVVSGASRAPATNRAIADELVLAMPTIKTHMRELFARFGVERELPQNQKRARLVDLAIRAGLVATQIRE